MFPDHPVTAKPLETRQGSGKGAPVGWCAPVKPGRILYEIKGVDLELAKTALIRASHKLPIKTVIATAQLEKTASIPATKKDIARVLTVMSEKGIKA